jgi:caffeoyl-CoA O-methyltransferase
MEIQKYADDNHVSIVEEEVANFLKVITGIKNPQRILEIGTGLGYSAISMAKSLKENAKIPQLSCFQEEKKKQSIL